MNINLFELGIDVVNLVARVVEATSLRLLCSYRMVVLAMKTVFLRVQASWLLGRFSVMAASRLLDDGMGRLLAPISRNDFALHAYPVLFVVNLFRLIRVDRRLLVTLVTGMLTFRKAEGLAWLTILHEGMTRGRVLSGMLKTLVSLLS